MGDFKDGRESRCGIPFGNHMVERSLRMLKAEIEISGCFRKLKRAKRFLRVR